MLKSLYTTLDFAGVGLQDIYMKNHVLFSRNFTLTFFVGALL